LSGLTELFSDQEFSMSWDVENFEDDFDGIDEEA